jgi:hypothetical protein
MKKVIYALGLVLLSSALVLTSCKKKEKETEDITHENVPTGVVMGKVLAQNGTTPIPMAKVFVDFNGEIYLTLTNTDGNFSLVAPAGAQVLNIQTGKGTIFRTQFNVDIPKDGQIQIPNGDLKLSQVANLAYIRGAYDEIEEILIDTLGYTADELTIADLADFNLLSNYAGLFLNCGKQGVLDSLKYANLLTFVQNGGSIYASDWAVEYLTGDGNYKSNTHNHTYTGPIDKTCNGRIGGFIADSLLCTQKTGPHTYVYGANVVPADLQTYLGVTTMDIEYDLGSWERIYTCLTPPWEVLIEDPNVFGPLAIRMYAAGNLKSLQNMMDQGWVTICHIPPGNPSNAHTITISVNALPAHLAHGDYIGACAGNGGSGGTIYYTTFHNHPQGGTPTAMQKVMEYFIINL